MKSVVMIAHGFPPEGHAGVHRPLRFVRTLPQHGWNPIVITREAEYYERYDPQLLKLVPADTEVVRVANRDPWQVLQARRAKDAHARMKSATVQAESREPKREGWRLRAMARMTVEKIESVVYSPDPAMLWIRPATAAAVRACRSADVRVVWATGGPWSSMVVARDVSSRTGRPYVLDFRDSWTLTHSAFEQRQPAWVKARDRRLLAGLLRDAHGVVFRYRSEGEAYWRVYRGWLDPLKVHFIPNGFEGSIALPIEVPEGDRCTLVYTGIVTGYWYEGLLDAIRLFRETDPEAAMRLRVQFVGEGTDVIGRHAASSGLSDLIEVSGIVPLAEADRLQRTAHALLLLGWKPDSTRGHELGGSKIFAYLKSGRPIVGVLPEDENSRILRSVGVDTIAHAGSPVEIMRLLQYMVRSWMAGKLAAMVPDRHACAVYSSERQTQALVRALEGLPAEEPFVPGTCAVPPSLEEWLSTVAGLEVFGEPSVGAFN